MSTESTEDRLILVTGVTGHQGGAVATHLLGRGFRVRGMTRTPDKPAARAMAKNGVEIVRGDLDNRDSFERALKGCYGVFSVQNYQEAGATREVLQGVTVADASSAAGIQHLVYSSVGSANRKTGIPHFESKSQIEQHIRSIRMPATILRPTFFMQNWRTILAQDIAKGVIHQPLDPETPLQQIAVQDIGAFAALAFMDPGTWIGREVDLAGEQLTMTEVARTISHALGREISYAQMPWDQFRKMAGEDMAKMYRWFADVGYEANIESLKKEYPEMSRLVDVIRTENWKQALLVERSRAA